MLRKNILAVLAGVFLLSISTVWAQDAPVEKTGQTTCWDSSHNPISCAGSGQDGNYLKGVAWPNPRFTDNGDSTVTDNLTGLMWTQDAQEISGTKTWQQALDACENLVLGGPYCGYNNWRLPNKKELPSLIHYGYYNPALPNTLGTGQWSAGDPFDNVQSNYWSSTSIGYNPSGAWHVGLYAGGVSISNKTNDGYVWCVRGGQ